MKMREMEKKIFVLFLFSYKLNFNSFDNEKGK